MSEIVASFDNWIRSSFMQMNTELEDRYFAQENRMDIENTGNTIKQQMVKEATDYIVKLLNEGNTDEGFDKGFDLLGNVGLYMAACRRHEISNPDRETTSPLREASALAMQIGASLGVTPRFSSSHLNSYNLAVNGVYKSFTSLKDEYIFTDYNTRGVFAFKRAADALIRILPLGISHPVTYDLLKNAKQALQDVLDYNNLLFKELDVERFFYCVRPYYKPHRVGNNIHRGVNAGDFAGINVIDLLLGLCQADNAYYSQLLVDKFLYMMPDDQAILRDCMRRKSLLNEFLDVLDTHHSQLWFQKNAAMFMEVCELHGKTAAQHHDQLVKRFIDNPAAKLSEDALKNITASGPPLEILLRALEKLRDLRMAAQRTDIPSRYDDIQRLKEHLN